MYYEDFSPNQKFSVKSVTVDEERMLAFAREYDPVPLHTDEDYAKATRFGRLIAPGVMSFMTVWAKFVENDIFADELIAGKSTKIEWFAPVFAGDVLSSEVFVSSMTERNAYNGIVELTFRVFNQGGKLVLTNVTETVVKRKAPISD